MPREQIHKRFSSVFLAALTDGNRVRNCIPGGTSLSKHPSVRAIKRRERVKSSRERLRPVLTGYPVAPRRVRNVHNREIPSA